MNKGKMMSDWRDPAKVAKRNKEAKVRMPADDKVDVYDEEGRFIGVGDLFTAVPNEISGVYKWLERSEILVLDCIVRQTYGYRRKTKGEWKPKEFDRIAISQFIEATALSKRAILDAVELLEERGLIEVDRSGGINAYNVKQRGVTRVSEEKAQKKRSAKNTIKATPATVEAVETMPEVVTGDSFKDLF